MSEQTITAITPNGDEAVIDRGCGASLGDDVAGISVPCGSLGRLCKRCQPWLDAGAAHALPDADYHYRARAVYRDKGHPACRSKGGPHHAICMLLLGHEGDHYGSGYDEGGPKPALRWSGSSQPNEGLTETDCICLRDVCLEEREIDGCRWCQSLDPYEPCPADASDVDTLEVDPNG